MFCALAGSWYAATSGNATVLGTDSRKISGSAFAEIGYVSKNQELPGWMKVGDFLEYLRPFYPSWDASLEQAMGRDFDLPLNRKLKQLSRGMQMKAALASSLAFHPKLIVLDEPFSGLDPLVRDELAKTLLQHASEATIFISSHDLAEVEGVATHVTFLEKGTARLSEDLALLRSRFREVELMLATPLQIVPGLPENWLQSTAAGTVALEVRYASGRLASSKRRMSRSMRLHKEAAGGYDTRDVPSSGACLGRG